MRNATPADFTDTTQFPAVQVPSSWLFCDPTRLANTYEPGVNRVWWQPREIKGAEVVIEIRHGVAPHPCLGRLGPRRRLESRLEDLRHPSPLDLGERLVYDARATDNSNMAHLIHYHLAMLGYFHQRSGFGVEDVAVLLESPRDVLAHKVFSLIGYETISTLRPVRGNHVTIAYTHFEHLLPAMRFFGARPWDEDGPKQILISRRNTRRIINEREIVDFLKARGFETLYFEDLPIIKQWSWTRGADRVVAIHGAALGCLAFQATRASRGPAADLIELFTPGFVVNPYQSYQASLGGRWVGCRGRLTPAAIRDADNPRTFKARAFDDFHLSVKTLDEALGWLAESESSSSLDSSDVSLSGG